MVYNKLCKIIDGLLYVLRRTSKVFFSLDPAGKVRVDVEGRVLLFDNSAKNP
jgi:hypothetical protein